MTWFAVGAAAVGAVNANQQSKTNDGISNIFMKGNASTLSEQKRQWEESKNQRLPFYEAGFNQLPMLGSQATGAGYNGVIQQLLQSGKLDPMIQQEQQAGRNMLSEAGLSRSGYGAKMIGSAPANVAMGMENQLNQRGQALAGFGTTAGVNYGTAGQAHSNAMSQLLQGRGDIQAQNMNANAQTQQDFTNNLVNLGAGYANSRWV